MRDREGGEGVRGRDGCPLTLIDDVKDRLKSDRPVANTIKFVTDIVVALWKNWVDRNIPFSRDRR